MSAAAAPAIAPLLAELGITTRELARGLAVGTSTAWRLARGQWPARAPRDLRERLVLFLKSRGAGHAHLRPLLLAPTLQVGRTGLQPGAAVSPEPPCQDGKENEAMLLKNERLSAAARKHFALARSPFEDDIQSREDVFASAHARYVRAALLEAALHHGFIAIAGESGSGKSTLREDLEERVREENRPIVLIKPYIHGVEPSEARGKPLRSGHIAEAIVDALAPGVSLKSSPQARYRQVHELLKASRAAGYHHLLVIEEAHRLPLPTLKHLKNFMELKDGLRRLLGVALIGQKPDLPMLLSERNPEVREIVQRCEVVTMEPLDSDLEAYLAHKFARVGAKLADMLEAGAVDAIRSRLINLPRGAKASDAVSVCYPLVVNNLVTRAMNAAAQVGYPKVDAEVIAGC